jgi:hypothetical protein
LSPTPDHPIPPPRRSDAELTAAIHERVGVLRRRQRARRMAVVAASTALLVALAATAAIAANHGGHGPTRVDTADDPTTTDAGPTTTTPPTNDSSTSVAPSSTDQPTTTVAPDSTTAPTTPSTPTTAPAPDCVAGQFDVTLTTDKASYALGEPVSIAATLHNTGGACNSTGTPAVLFFCSFASATNDVGKVVWNSDPCVAMTRFGPVPSGYTTTQKWVWNQRTCALLPPGEATCTVDGSQVPAGGYTIGETSTAWPPRQVTITIG